MTDPIDLSRPLTEAQFRALPLIQQRLIEGDLRLGDKASAILRRNATPAAIAARERYARSPKGRAARHAAYLRDKARRLAALEREGAARDPLFGR